MRGRIITSDHRIFELPVLLRWNITYTGGVPCDSYEVTCVYDRTMAELLHLAAGFLALDENGGVLLRGIVDEYEVKLTAAGLTVTICGRGYAARLLDNESRPVTYQGATLAEALEPGRSGNAAAGTIVILTACPVGITGCTNPAPFTGGSDQEDDASLRSRILESYQRLPNGANAAWYEQTAMGHEGVAAARAVGRARGIGTVDVYIATAAGLPNGTLLAAVQADLQERREIAVDVQVKAPAAVEMDVSAELAVREGADFSAVKAAAEQALASFFSGRRLGGPVLLAELGDLLYHVEGVENYRLLAPAADLAAEDGTLPMLGRVTVTEMEADDDV